MRRKLLSLQFLGQTDWSSINFHVICWIFCHYKWYVKWYIPLLHGFDYDWFWMNCFYIFFFYFFHSKKMLYTSLLCVIQRRLLFLSSDKCANQIYSKCHLVVYMRVSMDGLMYSSSCLSKGFKWHSFATASTTPKHQPLPRATMPFKLRMFTLFLYWFHRHRLGNMDEVKAALHIFSVDNKQML